MQTTRGDATLMKTLTQFKTALKAPMYRELTLRELMLYKTGFKIVIVWHYNIIEIK